MISAVTRRPSLVVALAALLGVSALLVVVSAPAASAAISWSAVNPPLPVNAVAGGGLTIASSSCPADGWCIGVGNYLAVTGGNYYTAGLIISESGGTWTSTESPLPGNASADPQAFLQAVTCTGVGSCVAVGRYLDASGATQGLVEQLSGGVWAPSEVGLPAGALATGSSAYAQLSAVACPSAGWCTAVGLYSQGGTEQALIDTDVFGTWSATTAPLPAPAPGSQFLALACSDIGACVATGTYLEGGSTVGFADVLSGGTWAASTLPVPSGTSSAASIANNDLAVSCPADGSCVVAGTTFDGNYEGLLDTLSGGTWSAAAVPTPGGQPSTDVQLTSVACTDPNTCVATGFVSVSGVEQGLLESLGSGTWTPSVAPAPSGTPAGDVELHDVACPAAGTCVADGQIDVAGAQSGLFWDLSSGVWSVTAAPLPADAASGSDPSFAPIACPGAGVCLAVGTYLGASGSREGVIETDPSLAATATTVSAQRVSGQTIVYSASVVGSAGPTGTVTFSGGLEALCTAPISNGTATCTGPQPQSTVVLGSYSGDGTSAPSWGTGVSPIPANSIIVISGSGQSAMVNGWFPHTLVVEVTGSSGTGVPGVVVTFLVPTSGASAVLWGPKTAVTNAAGIASSPWLTANRKVGSYTVLAIPNTRFEFALFGLTNYR